MKRVMVSTLVAASVFLVGLFGAIGESLAWSPELKVRASKYEKENRPDGAIDQDGRTHWTCRGKKGECWIEFDLGVGWESNDIYLVWLNTRRNNFFDVRLSNDGKAWKTVYSGDSDHQYDYFGQGILEFEWQAFRYVRVYGYGNSVSDHNSICEFAPFYPDVDSRYRKRPVVNVAASSHAAANTPDLAIDGNLKTFWTSPKMGEWIQFDLGYVETVENIKIAWMNGHMRKSDFDIEVSVDGVNWELAHSGTSTGATLAMESNTLGEEHCARYVRIVGWGNDIKDKKSQVKTSITEVEIWGYERWNEWTCEEEISSVGRM